MSNVVIIATPSEDMKEYYHETLDVLDDMTINKNQWELNEEDEEAFKAYHELYANNEVKIH
jgi:predicted DNA-binding ArsR family transcriptional regulator